MWQEIEKQLNGQLPFVVYRKPTQEEVNVIFQKDDVVHMISDFSEKGFVFAPFNSKKTPILIKKDINLKFQFLEWQDPQSFENVPRPLEASHDDYIGLLKTTIDEIDAGRFRKVVLSRILEVENLTSPLMLLKRILSIYKNAFCYLWYHPNVGMWLGATPEVLLHSDNRVLTTMSLAGTMRYEGAINPDWGEKELDEQKLVTDFILNTLADKVSNLKKSDTETIRAGELLHLRTTIKATLKDNRLDKIVRALHPTPAVCGFPRAETLNFIKENESYEREFYGGYLGELNIGLEKSSTFYVNLRCMQKAGNKMKIYVGGGITTDSDPEKEWQETVDKSGTMLRILAAEN